PGLCLSPCHLRDSVIDQLYSQRAAGIGFDHDVRRLYVPMHDTACFSSNQRPCRLLNYFQRKREWHWPVAADTGFERFALDQFHGIKTLAVSLPIVSDASDVWMTNVRRCARFTQKTRPRVGNLCYAAVDDFESND